MITVKEAYEKYYKAKFEKKLPYYDSDGVYHTYCCIISFLMVDDYHRAPICQRKFPKYGKWIVEKGLKENYCMPGGSYDDLYKLRSLVTDDNCTPIYGYIDVFDMLKKRRMISGWEADINTYPTIQALGEFLSKWDFEEVMGNNSDNALRKRINENGKDEIDVIYEDDEWKTLIPKTYEASCYWGTDTHWCTATRSDRRMYDHYTKQGPLYININKLTGRKYQFHFPSKQFMDEKDCRLDGYTYKAIMNSCNYMNCVFKGNARIYSHILSKGFDMYDGFNSICLYGDGSNELEIWDFNANTRIFYIENVQSYKVNTEGETKYIRFYDGNEQRIRLYGLENQEYLYDSPTRYRFLDSLSDIFVYDYVDSVIINVDIKTTYKVNHPVEAVIFTMGGRMFYIATDKQFYHLDGRPIFPNMRYSTEKRFLRTYVIINDKRFEVAFDDDFNIVKFMIYGEEVCFFVDMEDGQMTLNEDEVFELYKAKLSEQVQQYVSERKVWC